MKGFRFNRISLQSKVLCGKLVLFADVGLLLGSEIVVHLEELSDFLDTLTLDQGGDLGRAQLEQRLDVEVISSQDDIEEQSLVHILGDVFGIPCFNVLRKIV